MINVIKFGAAWCRPCKSFEPIFSEVVEEFSDKDIKFSKVDVDEDEGNLTDKYLVRNVPTIIITDDSEEVLDRRAGLMTKEDLIKVINRYLN